MIYLDHKAFYSNKLPSFKNPVILPPNPDFQLFLKKRIRITNNSGFPRVRVPGLILVWTLGKLLNPSACQIPQLLKKRERERDFIFK